MEKKIYVVGGSTWYASFLDDYILVGKPEDANVIIFTGGEDVSPSLYKMRKHSKTSSNLERDKREKEIFENLDPERHLVIGICRGSQLCSVLNGGKLVQHCTGHGLSFTHEIHNDEFEFQITSTHHQMQYPFNLDEGDYDLLYVSRPRSDRYEGLGGLPIEPILKHGEPEIVLYHKPGLPRCLAIQGHPEMMPKESPVCGMLRNLINSLL